MWVSKGCRDYCVCGQGVMTETYHFVSFVAGDLSESQKLSLHAYIHALVTM